MLLECRTINLTVNSTVDLNSQDVLVIIYTS
jgi:hypothetical protein